MNVNQKQKQKKRIFKEISFGLENEVGSKCCTDTMNIYCALFYFFFNVAFIMNKPDAAVWRRVWAFHLLHTLLIIKTTTTRTCSSKHPVSSSRGRIDFLDDSPCWGRISLVSLHQTRTRRKERNTEINMLYQSDLISCTFAGQLSAVFGNFF